MASLDISRFRRQTFAMELRYPPAYGLWDRAGLVALEIQSLFNSAELQTASPGHIAFNCENRYTVSVLLDKAIIFDGTGNITSASFPMYNTLFESFARILHLDQFSRVGTRFVYHMVCKSEDEASDAMKELRLLSLPRTKMFDVSPNIIAPTYIIEVKDDDLGYRIQINYQTRKLELKASPEMISMGVAPITKEETNIVIDIDLFTTRPLDLHSFNTSRWLERCTRLVNRDIDDFLVMGVRARG